MQKRKLRARSFRPSRRVALAPLGSHLNRERKPERCSRLLDAAREQLVQKTEDDVILIMPFEWTKNRPRQFRHSPSNRVISAVFAHLFAVMMIGNSVFLGPALAQITENPDPISLGDLFSAEDSVDLAPDATAILQGAALLGQAEGNCPKGTITIVVAATDDPLFQEALARARLEIVEQALGDHALDWRLETIHDGFADEVKVEYGRSDQEPPRLDVVWTPPQGTEVAPGDTITATIVANDDSDTFQTGIASISMEAGNEAPFGHEYPQPPQTCEAMAPAQQMEGFYAVPDPAPTQVNMRATAMDFAGNELDLLAAFPTRREPCASGVYWTGTISGSWTSVGAKETAAADAVRLCEREIMPPLQHLLVGQQYLKSLSDDGSTITYVQVDTDGGDSCDYSGEGTALLQRDVGLISSVLNAIGPNGELQWSAPTYWLSAGSAGTYTATMTCPGVGTFGGDGPGWPIIVGSGADPEQDRLIQDGSVMAGNFADPDGGLAASWSLTREGEAPIFPANVDGAP